ncbi:MAG TPA: ice-binding family protein [Saprospiraceae bacterium]|nr:ice-binding family protein [Saprospiraceae bacterium]
MKTPFSFLLFTLLFIPKICFGQAPDLGSASSFAVFTAVGAFSNDGATVVTGDIGTDAGSFTGFPPGIVIGEIHVADTEADDAAVDVMSAYSFLDALTCGTVIGVTLGGGQILTPDIYCAGAATTINGNLILDAQGDADALFIFQIDGALSTGTLANIVLINGASLCNVWWQVNGAFTLGDGSVFRGNVLANGAIHLLEASSLFGRALSQAGAIDLHNNVVSIGLPPVAAVITASGAITFCAGGSVTLSGNVDGVWSNGSVTASILVTVSGDFYVVNTTLCGSDTSNHIIVTVLPDTPPTISCPSDLTIECGQNTLPANTGTATASDTCDPAPSITFSDVTVAGACAQAFTIIRLWTATDDDGNTDTCNQNINVEDSTPPVFTCFAVVSPIECGTEPVFIMPTATDGCDGSVDITFTEITTQGVCFQEFTVSRVWTATDDCGNTSICFQSVSIVDDIAPTISCPANLTLECTASTLPASTGTATAIDNCAGAPIITSADVIISSLVCLQQSVIIRTWTATDGCGNVGTCNQTINIVDTTSPSIECPVNVTLACGADTSPAGTGTATGADNCDPDPNIDFTDVFIPAAGCPSIVRTWSITDDCGNSSTCDQIITITNVTILTILCPGDITVNCASLIPGPDVTLVVTSSNCPGTIVVTFAGDVVTNQSCANQFVVIRTYVATDACGSTATCTQAITVFDNIPPSITCPGNVTVQCAAQVPVTLPDAVVSIDNCGGLATITFIGEVISNQTCVNGFTLTRTYRTTDGCGNFQECNQVITVFDNIAPLLTCPVNISVQCASQVPAPNPAVIVTSENCVGGATVTFAGDVVSNFVCANQFLVNRTYLATDACGNTSACIQNITVFDNSPITVVCPVNITVQCASLVPAVNLNLQVTSAACGGTTTVALLSEIISNQTCANRFTVTRTYLATDACAQSQTCVQIITVADDLPPVIILPAGLLNGGTLDVQCFGQDPNWDMPVFDESSITANDNCGGNVTVTFEQELIDSGTCVDDGYINFYTLTWTATDVCGNSSSAFVFLALIDTIPPVIVGVPADITVNCDAMPALPLLISATDECLCACILVVEESTPSAGCLDGQVVLRTWTAKDRCGNSTTVTQRITLNNNQETTLQLLQPEMSGMVDGSVIEFSCSEGGIPGYFNLLGSASIVATSSCGNLVNLTFDRTVTEAAHCDFSGYIEQQILHWAAVDLCGNEVSLTITVRLTDDVAPVLIGVPEIACINDPSLKDVEAFDNCSEAHVRFWESKIPNPCGPGMAIRRTYEAYDDCGNIMRDTTILIPNDLVSPNLEFVNPLLLNLDLGEVITLNCAAHDLQLSPFGPEDVISHNSCIGKVNVTFNETTMETGDCSGGGNVALMQLMWTATDVCGNLSTLSVIASVEDQSSPIFMNLVPVVNLGCNDSLPGYVALDNCGSVTITTSDRYFKGDCVSKYSIEREITATDPCGNSTVGFQTINVGSAGPVIDGVEDEICDDLSMPVVTAFDECAGVFVDVQMSQDTLEAECRGMVIQRTWSAVSKCGDTTSVTQLIVVGDTTAPVIQIPSFSILYKFIGTDKNIVLLSQADLIKKLNELNGNSISVFDDCQDIVPVFTVVITTFDDCLATGFIQHRVYTWVATDACGNSTSVTIIVDITDDVPPVIITIPADTMIVCAPLPAVPVIDVEDFAQPVTIVFTESIIPGDGLGYFNVTRTWTITDACGNVTVLVQNIIWISDSYLTCDIIVPEVVECNSHGVIITSVVTGGFGPYTYEWEVVGGKCFIQGGQGTPEITIYMGWEDVKIILNVTDTFGCVTMCMYILNCLEPGEIPVTINQVSTIQDNNPEIHATTTSVFNQDQGVYMRDLNLWPNPATGTINLSFESSVDDDVVYSFRNFLGQVMLSDKIDVRKGLNTNKIDVEKLAGGSYLIEIKSNKEMLTKVIVILPRD